MKEIFSYIGYATTISGLVACFPGMYGVWKAFFKRRFTLRRLEKGVGKLVPHINMYNPDLVVGIGYGGMIIGGLIAGRLGSKPLVVLNCNNKEIEEAGAYIYEPDFDRKFQIGENYRNILLVKGVTKTGTTLKTVLSFMQEKFPEKEFRYAVLVKQSSLNVPVRYCAYEVDSVKKLPWKCEIAG